MAGEFKVTVRVREGGYNKKGNLRRGGRDNDLTSDLNGKITLAELLEFTKQSLISVAEEAFFEEITRGFDRNATRIVDGNFNKPIEQVHPLGKIQYVARADFKQLILDTYDAIRIRTRRVTGQYGRNNIVLYNGNQVAQTRSELVSWVEKQEFQGKDVVRFLNAAPYARKLELKGVSRNTSGGVRKSPKTKTRGKSDKRLVGVPNGTYALAFKAISSKYKNNAFIRLRMVSGEKINIQGRDVNEKTGKKWRRHYKKDGRPYWYPSILISAVEQGMIK